MGKLLLAPRDLPAVVRDVLRLIAHEGADASDQRLARWRTDPEIVALLSSLSVLDLSTLCLLTSRTFSGSFTGYSSFIEENNLSHLFGCTPNLTALDLMYYGQDSFLLTDRKENTIRGCR